MVRGMKCFHKGICC